MVITGRDGVWERRRSNKQEGGRKEKGCDERAAEVGVILFHDEQFFEK